MKNFAHTDSSKDSLNQGLMDQPWVSSKLFLVELNWPNLSLQNCSTRFGENLGFKSIESLKLNFFQLFSSRQLEVITGLGLGTFKNVSLEIVRADGDICSFDVTIGQKLENKLQLYFYDVTKYGRNSLLSWNKVKSSFHEGSIYEFCDAASIGVVRINAESLDLMACNDYMAKILGFSSALEFIKFSELQNDEDRLSLIPELNDLNHEIHEKGVITNKVVRIQLPNVAVKYLRVSAKISNDEKYIEGTCIDVSDLYETKKALAESQFMLHGITNGIDAVVFQCKTPLEGEVYFTYVSRQVEEIFEVTADEIIQDSSVFFKNIFPEDLAIIRESIDSYFHTLVHYPLDYRVKKSDGSVVWCRGMSSPINSPDGSITWNGMILDVTQEIEGELQREEMLKELAQANKMKALGTLAGGIAHDFNNIIQGIRLSAELTKAKIKLGKSIDFEKTSDDVLNFCKRGADLVRQILIYCRKDDVRKESMNLCKEIDRSMTSISKSIPHNIIFKCEKKQNRILIEGDITQIHQVIQNLVNNSVYEMKGFDQGEIHLFVDEVRLFPEEKTRLKLHGKKFARLVIEDTGPGMTEDIKSRILEPFFTTKPVGEGTGLGLSVVQGVMNGHGGALDIESEQGAGTKFMLYFPISDVEVHKEEVESKVATIKGKENILLVDDESDLRELTQTLLEGMGYQVHSAEDGASALAFYEENKDSIDLVVTDQTMPRMMGTELCKRLRKIDPDQRIIVVSGYLSKDMQSTIDELGIQGFVEKPFTVLKLGEKIRSALTT